MPTPHQQGIVAANATTSTTFTFDDRVSHLRVWSPDDEFHLGFDEDAVDTTIAYSINIVYDIPIGCKTLGVLLQTDASGNVNVIGIKPGTGVHDEQVQENRGGIDVSPAPTYF